MVTKELIINKPSSRNSLSSHISIITLHNLLLIMVTNEIENSRNHQAYKHLRIYILCEIVQVWNDMM